jgi:hypothetical protein
MRRYRSIGRDEGLALLAHREDAERTRPYDDRVTPVMRQHHIYLSNDLRRTTDKELIAGPMR